MSGTQDAARLREALAIVLKEGAGLILPPLDDSVLIARLNAVCTRFHDRPRLTPQELLSSAQGERFEPVFRDLLVETFSDRKTAFFRDKQTFAYIGDNLFADSTKKTVTIWCAACSIGQEALSLAMTWRKRFSAQNAEQNAAENNAAENNDSEEAGRQLKVYASDLSARAIETARRGRYNNFDVQHGLKVYDLLNFFEEQQGGGFWKAKDALLSHTIFFQHNLLRSPPSFLPRRLDVIFLPHTLQNIDDAVAERILVRLTSLLAPDGWLVLAPSEANRLSDRFGDKFFSPSLEARSKLPQGMFSRRAFAHPDRGEEGQDSSSQDSSQQDSSSQDSSQDSSSQDSSSWMVAS